MDRVEYIKDFEPSALPERMSLLSAFLSCLNPIESCSVLDTTFNQDWLKRRAILKKITRDIQAETQDSHYALIRALMGAYEGLPYEKLRPCANTLGYLCEYMPESIQDQVIRFLLESKYVGTRRTGYRKLASHWKDDYRPLIEDNWQSYQDPECTRVIIDNFPIEYLDNNSLELRDRAKGTRYLSRLYLRLAEYAPAKLDEIREVDGVSFTYVSAKMKKTLDDSEALTIFEKYKYDERLGLLIWCFGQMRLWSVLERINRQIETLAHQRATRGPAKKSDS